MIEVIAVDRVAPQPWSNGGGFTRELLRWPGRSGSAGLLGPPPGAAANSRPGAHVDGDWQARISLADITRDGAFSGFDGVTRWIAVADGPGVVLRFATRRVLLTRDDAPLSFDGAEAPYAELQDGATRDLNLMLRRDAGSGGMQRAAPGDEWISAAPLRALFVAAPARLQIDDADAARLPAFALAWSPHATRQRWRVVSDGDPPHAWWLWFRPKQV